MKDYCKKCNKHTAHKLKQFKPGSTRTLAEGTRKNIQRKRGYKGKFQFPAKIKKQNKKPVFLAECTACHTKHYFVIHKRMKKVELGEKSKVGGKEEKSGKQGKQVKQGK
ncbi:MAG: 50S ribosomal protein L44e [Candidatus Diapherotrites archaeon]|nr:50S ribosomal protein L44e [Candidatus Diapherotrites archaeon]